MGERPSDMIDAIGRRLKFSDDGVEWEVASIELGVTMVKLRPVGQPGADWDRPAEDLDDAIWLDVVDE